MTMKRIFAGGIALLGFVAVAHAADLPPRYQIQAPPPPPPVRNWTGLYVGAGVGYGMWDGDTSFVLPVTGATSSVTNNGGRGWVGQAVVGYDYQFAVAGANLVAGVFGDYDFGHISGTIDTGLANAVTNTLGGAEKERSYWNAGARIGWLVTPQILSYVDGGYTQARFDGVNLVATGIGAPFPAQSIAANTYHGWFTGGGVETMVTAVPGLFFNTEYRYESYSSATFALPGLTPLVGTPTSLKFEPHVQTVMSGVRYKFNWF